MIRSINVSKDTKDNIKKLKEIMYPISKVTDGYIINVAVKTCGVDYLKKTLSKHVEGSRYGSYKFKLDYEANEMIDTLMNMGYTADAIINESLKQRMNLELYKRRVKMISKMKMKMMDTHSRPISMINYLPVIYSVRLSHEENEVVLYVGKSKLFASRESTHLMEVIDDPAYFGLEDEDLLNEQLSLSFRIEYELDVMNIENMSEFDRLLSEKEAEICDQLQPLTQNGLIMVKNQEEKRKRVKQAIQQLLKK